MKILFVTALYNPYIGGGAEISNQLLIEALAKRDIEVEVITLGEEEKIEIINQIKVRRIFLNKALKILLQNIKNKNNYSNLSLSYRIILKIYKILSYSNILFNRKVKLLLDEIKPDIIHTTGVHYFFPQLWWKIAKQNNLKVIHTLRDPLFIYFRGKYINKNYYILDKFQRKYYDFYLNKYVDMIHSPSNFMIQKHIESGINIRNKKIIYNTIKEKQENIGYFDSKKIDILFVGNIDYYKGIKTLIKLKKINLDLKIVCIGEGELAEECIKNEIVVKGWLKKEEVYEYIKDSKILILPSEWEEAFGRVLLEGVMNGTLVLGSDQGAIPEVLGNKNEYIFRAKDVNELYSKVTRILDLDEKKYKKEVRNMQNYMEKYSYKNHIDNFIKLYRKLLRKE